MDAEERPAAFRRGASCFLCVLPPLDRPAPHLLRDIGYNLPTPVDAATRGASTGGLSALYLIRSIALQKVGMRSSSRHCPKINHHAFGAGRSSNRPPAPSDTPTDLPFIYKPPIPKMNPRCTRKPCSGQYVHLQFASASC